MKRHALIVIFLVIQSLPGFVQGQDWDSYRQQSKSSFSEYKREIDEQFKAYKAIIDEEYRKMDGKLRSRWPDAYLGSKDEYVWYSEDLKTRVIINYTNQTIVAERYDGKISEEQAKEAIQHVLMLTEKDAFQENELLDNIERRTRSEIPEAITGELDDTTPVFKDFVRENIEPEKAKDNQDVSKMVTELVKKSTTESKNNRESIVIKPTERPIADQSGGENTPKTTERDVPTEMPIHSSNSPLSAKAEPYESLIKSFSGEHKIAVPLVFAIMESESSFNPMAKSPIPAYGLMQIVPTSAGKDATEFVFGEPKVVSASYLFNKKNNIQLGTAYLHIVYYRYLRKIDNKLSRVYCTIAAYNTGAGNVAKAFIGSKNISRASEKINTMSPDEVYHHLVENLPYEETRIYLPKVRNRIQNY